MRNLRVVLAVTALTATGAVQAASNFDENGSIGQSADALLIGIPAVALGLTWLLGITLILWHVYAAKEGWAFLAQPWMATKLAAVIFLSGWHGFLSASRRRIAAGERPRSAKFWRATNEIPFLVAIVAVLAVTLQFGAR